MIWVTIYLLSIVVTGAILVYEYRNGAVYGYRYSTREYIFGVIMSVIPVVNTLFGLYLIAEYLFERN